MRSDLASPRMSLSGHTILLGLGLSSILWGALGWAALAVWRAVA